MNIKFEKPIKSYNPEMLKPAFELIKKYKDILNIGNIQSFLDEYIDKTWRGRVCKILIEGGIDIFPEQENFISDCCFEGNDLIEIEIPSHIEIIGAYVFSYSTLDKIFFSQGSKLRILGFGSFAGTWIKEIELPNGIEHLDGSVFDCCTELKEVILPDTLQSIGSRVFKNCHSLEKLIYKGTIEQFNQIYKDKAWLEHSSIQNVICLDGVVNVN